MELITVKMEDVYPDESNPREDFGDIAALAESFDLNPERPGEPFTPPILVRDGGIFRIVDGERRYRALAERGAESFAANVCADMDEADSVVAMLATDDKMPLSDIERSRGVQKMLLLGVDPEKVEKAGRMERGRAAAVRRARELVDDAGDDMTLERMYAVAEFDGDDEAVKKIMNASERDWEREAAAIRTARERIAAIEALVARAEACGATIMTDEDAMKLEGYRYDYRFNVQTPDDLERAHAENPEVVFGYSKVGGAAYGYRPAADETKADPEEEARQKAAAELAGAFDAAFAELNAWAKSGIVARGGGSFPHVRDICIDQFKEYVGFDELCEDFPSLLEEGTGFSRTDMAAGWSQVCQWGELSQQKARAIMDLEGGWRTSDVPDMGELFDAARADGFAFSEAAQPAADAVAAFIAGEGEDGEPEGGE